MHSYRPIGEFDKIHSQTNSPILEEYIDFNSYNIWVPPASFFVNEGTQVLGDVNKSPFLEFPDAVTTGAGFAFRKPRMWGKGTVSANVWYTGDLVAATNAYCTLSVMAQTVGEVLAAPTASAGNLLPTPTAANTLMLHQGFTNTRDGGNVDVTDVDQWVVVNFKRLGGNASDTYTDDLKLLGLEIIYKETRHPFAYRKSDFINRNRTVNR